MSLFHSFLMFAGVLFHTTYGFVDFGSLTLPVEPIYQPTPRPNQLQGGFDLRYEVLPSMITAVAPSVTIAANGTRQTMYSVHYHHYFSKTRQGRGVFDKRGVFASDPPIATCTPCEGPGVSSTFSITSTSTLTCTTITYHGVFDFPPTTTGASCYDTNYSGVFQSSTSSTTGLPCCFTIPASCLLNSTTSTSFMASTGVFRPTTTSTTTAFSSSAASSRSSLTIPTSTSGTSSQSQGPILNSGSSSTSTSTTVTVVVTATSTSTPKLTTTTSKSSSFMVSGQPYTSPSTSRPSTSNTSLSIIVISSTTITITNSATAISTAGSGTSSSLSTLTVITGSASSTMSTSASASLITTTVPDTIIGCGQASGSGIIIGTGTVYLEGTPIVTSGTASGFANNVSGCGTIIATSGTFTGSATITGCGSGSGTGTLTGTGTVWPAYMGGLISLVTSGTVSGSGNFSGCGTLTGSGTFVATTGSPILVSPSTTPTPSSRPIKTVSVYLSYCPEPMGANDILRLAGGSNMTSPPTSSNTTLPYYSSPSSSSSNTTLLANNSTGTNPLCQTCPNTVGVCCPPTVRCQADDGKCPLYALENSGNTINGYLIAQVMNSSAPVAGRKKVRALEKKQLHNMGSAGGGQDNKATAKGFGGKDLLDLEAGVERQLQRHREKKRAHKKQF
ncbi:uncharacterized protein Z520_07663 [Fonsecaea multimorphosa CBS 102226]|uniref:Uncharacterized protein n=1 Tax=Fonsecaea multimorphosa CBS 102226 TaxID=1442371 RepID=A0A0D2JSH4_9EURO|nr:uncharacterized protein Z520_07663 [Fonsecaea multimorphosa CBS 102226]KIX96397.1 hypothetical protein Z520_07663 [Fonsecaea multimorphosa CBS 102226]OAL22309.1 hypothetical protein AYO22_07353 [Fonsecaea multimorphosa]